MCAGPELFLHLDDCWGALQADDDDPQGNIGDIYYFSKCSKPKQPDTYKLYWFTVADDGESLELQGWSDSQDQGWLPDWRTAIVPKLRKLAVTVLDNTPHILGWADQVVSPDSFTVHVSVKTRPSLKSIAAGSYYILMRTATPPQSIPDQVKPGETSRRTRLSVQSATETRSWSCVMI
jgi:hypothetical protein